jgi:hypothetical protein
MKFMACLSLLGALAGCGTSAPPVSSTVPAIRTAAAMAGPLRPSLEQLALSPTEQAAVRAAETTGTGSAASPIKPAAVSTEYAFLRQHGLRFERHAVIAAQPAPIDRLTATRRATGQTEDVFFQCQPDSPDARQTATAMRSLLSAGDGRSMATAWPTTSVPLEYAILRLLGLQRIRQELLRGPSQSFDKLEVVDPIDQTHRDVYFRLVDMGLQP